MAHYGKQDNTFLYVIGALALLLGWKFGKSGKGEGEGSTGAVVCTSAMSNDQCAQIGRQLRELFESQYFWIGDDVQKDVIDRFRNITDSCGCRKVYAAFGELSSFTVTSGGLDNWMEQCSTETKNACRLFTYGVSTF